MGRREDRRDEREEVSPNVVLAKTTMARLYPVNPLVAPQELGGQEEVLSRQSGRKDSSI